MAQNLSKRTIDLQNFYGYTLIELLIVMMTMVLLFGLGFANYRGFQRRQSLEGVVRMVKADLRLAQANALSGKKPSSGNCSAVASNILYYSFAYVDSDTYAYGAVCPTESNIKQVDITGATMSAFSEIRFNVLGRGTNITGQTVITITSGAGSKDITVRSGGTIE
ncbi:MAG: hypothetical protein UT24_C0001G0024 [Candidatus Woesebacteria bacterium GW2011_GWB1_39_12]|uniref:Uncharacterized protein n=2 Tax=Candidatus Woeseibacteriota TaxID=1752722 RepID=A0A0G0M3I1_9BACT|nr:MAG: hypothetical protein UT23_C0001G0024 [Candidatus Woesebacteria bacterium GW2011_GWA1_39_12]KKR01864.1 MAG: hypothetical protein UT24_C0001G0024 [Candidatus Woesebacteria bacterium GW2011_GWB1_39_12]